MKRFCLALVSVAALASAAAAADLPLSGPAPYYKAPGYFAPPYSWTGFYLGLNGGGGLGRSTWDSAGGFNVSGGLVGATAGYNYQIGQAVVGAEGDIDWSNIDGSTSTACPLGCKTTNTWLSTLRGRLGYAAGSFMPFITGGAAFGTIRATTPGFAGNSATNAGWTVGAGLEFGLTGNWTVKAEYLYVDLGSFNCGLACGASATDNVSFKTNIVRAGVNFRF
jgi:outer membrane immunogenic protein